MSNYNSTKPVNTYSNRNESSSGKKVGMILAATIVVAGLGAAALYLVDVDQTKEARLPSVDVQVTEGQMPAFDAEVADVKVGSADVEVDVPTVGVETKTVEIEVPVDVNTDTESKTLEVPTLDIERPEVDDPADNPTK